MSVVQKAYDAWFWIKI